MINHSKVPLHQEKVFVQVSTGVTSKKWNHIFVVLNKPFLGCYVCLLEMVGMLLFNLLRKKLSRIVVAASNNKHIFDV